jgi:hypothetical protein
MKFAIKFGLLGEGRNMTSKVGGETYFRIMPWILIALVIAGFGSAQLQGSRPVQDLTWINILHGLVMLAWFGLLVVQPRLIAARNYSMHKQLGWASIVLAFAMVRTDTAGLSRKSAWHACKLTGLSPHLRDRVTDQNGMSSSRSS